MYPFIAFARGMVFGWALDSALFSIDQSNNLMKFWGLLRRISRLEVVFKGLDFFGDNY